MSLSSKRGSLLTLKLSTRCVAGHGYFLGQIDVVAENIEPISLLIVANSVLPIALEVLRARREHRKGPLPAAERDLSDELPTK